MTKFINEEFLDVLFDKGPATLLAWLTLGRNILAWCVIIHC